MATTIKIKNSATPGSTPSSLEQGEMALNVTDGKLFYGSGSGNDVKEFTGGGGSPTDTGSFATTGSNTFIGNQIISGNVEITGAITASVVSASYIDLDVLANGDIPAHKAGRIFFGAEDGALEVYNEEADITLQVGQEFWVRVYNPTASPIANGTPVRASGSQGDRIRIYPAVAEDHTAQSVFENHILGITTHEIEAGTEGYVTSQGIVRGVDTSAFSAGDILFLQTGSVGFRNTPPPFPYDIVQVGYVARSASPNGFIFVQPKEPVHFNVISGLSGSSVAEPGDLFIYQANNAWSPGKTLSGSYTIDNGNLDVQGNLTASSILALGNIQAGQSGNGYKFLGSTDGDQTIPTFTDVASPTSGMSIVNDIVYLVHQSVPTAEISSSKFEVYGQISGRIGTNEYSVSDIGSSNDYSGDIIKLFSNSLSVTKVYYLGKTSWAEADNRAEASSDKLLAIATGTNSNQGMLLKGLFNLGYDPGGFPGDPVYLDAGGIITSTLPTTSGEVVRILGYNVDTNIIYFNPSNDYIVLS